MSVKDNREGVDLRFFLKAWAAWFVAAVVLLVLFSFLISRTAGSSRAMAYLSSALIFLTAIVSGAAGTRSAKLPPVLTGLLCGAGTILLLLLIGFLIDRKNMNSDAVLSLVSFTLAGFLVGSVFFGARAGRNGKKRSFSPHKGSGRRA